MSNTDKIDIKSPVDKTESKSSSQDATNASTPVTKCSSNQTAPSSSAQTAARLSGLDLVRTIACLFVVSAHFYLNVGYYNTPLVGTRMFIMTAARWMFVTAVPLFFMLTGYFKINKEMTKSHYKALIPLVISYVLVSVAKMILYNKIYGKIYTVKDLFINLGNYQIAWYMGLYLCVFLLIPFINKMWKALNTKEQNVLLGTLVFLVAIYPVFNYIAPSYFIEIYPVLFYFLGAAVRKRRYRPNRFVLAAITLLVCILEAAISMLLTKTGVFDWTVISTADGTYGTLFIGICTVCIFLLFYDINIKSRILNKIMASISRVSFEIYLFAGAYDALIYRELKERVTGGANDFFWWFFITVPLSFIAAWISSVIFKYIIDLILKKIPWMNK